MDKKILKSVFIAGGLSIVPIVAISANTEKAKVDDEKDKIFVKIPKIKGAPVWYMHNDKDGKELPKEDLYYGVLLPVGTDINKLENDIRNLLKDKSQHIQIHWQNKYDKDKEGVYQANVTLTQSINNSSYPKVFTLKIFVTGEKFKFESSPHVPMFEFKTLPEGFTIPNNVTSIDKNQFWKTKLNEDFKIPNTVTDLGSGSFSFISKLPKNFNIGSLKLKAIHENTFEQTKLNDKFVIPEGVTKIEDNSFKLSVLNKDFKIPETVQYIKDCAFSSASLNKNFRLPKGLKNFKANIFEHARERTKRTTFDSIVLKYETLKSVDQGNEMFQELSLLKSLLTKFIEDPKRGSLFNAFSLNTTTGPFVDKNKLIELIKAKYNVNQSFLKENIDRFFKGNEDEHPAIEYEKPKGMHIRFSMNINNGEEIFIGKNNFNEKISEEAEKDVHSITRLISDIKDTNLNIENNKITPVVNQDFNKDVFEKLGGKSEDFPEDLKGTKLTYTHNGITKDGYLEINVHVSKEYTQSAYGVFKVKVSGIDKSKAIDNIKIIKDKISELKNVKLNSSKHIDAISDGDFDEKLFKQFVGEKLEFPIAMFGNEIKFSHDGIAKDGKLTFNVQISNVKHGLIENTSFKVDVSGIDKAKDDDDIEAVKNIISGWKQGKLDVNKGIDAVSLSDFNAQELQKLSRNTLTLPSDIHGTTLKFSHDGITQDGPLKVNVDISKGKGETVSASFTIDVSGIDKAKADADIAKVKKTISEWKDGKLNTSSEIQAAKSKNLDKQELKDLAGGSLTFPSDIHGTTLKFSHGGISQDGTLKVKVDISKSKGETVSTWFTIIVSGIDKAKADADIQYVKNILAKLKEVKINTQKEIPSALNAVFTKETLKNFVSNYSLIPFDTKGTQIKFSHDGISKDGTLEVKVDISKGQGDAVSVPFKIIVSGIDKAKADADITEVKKTISGWKDGKLNTSSEIKAVNNKTLDEQALKALSGGSLSLPSDIHGTTLKFSHGGISQDGTLKVKVDISKSKGDPVSTSFTINVSGIDKAKADADIAKVKKTISEWKDGKLNTSSEIQAAKSKNLDKQELKDLAGGSLSLPTDIHGTTLKFSHGGISQDGQLKVKVDISKSKGKTVSTSFTINVSGIDKAKADADIAEVAGYISNLNGGKLSVNDNINSVKNELFNDKSLKAISGGSLSLPSDIHGTSLKFSHDGISKDGPLKVNVNISKGKGKTVSTSFTINVSGIDKAKADADIAKVEKSISAWTDGKLNTSIEIKAVNNQTLNKQTLKDLAGGSLSLPSDIHDTTLKFSHDGISKDGQLKVKVDISKSKGKTVSTSFTINVSGIDKANDDADIQYVQNILTTLSKVKINIKKEIPSALNTVFTKDTLKNFVSNYRLIPLDTKGTHIKFSHNGISKDGTLEVKVDISKGKGETVSVPFKIIVSGIDKAKTDADIAELKKTISAWTDGKLNTSSKIKSVNNKTLDKKALEDLAGDTLSFPSDIHDTKLKFSHDGISKDGQLKVNVVISKSKGKTVSTSFTIDVSGLDKAKDDADIAEVAGYISAWQDFNLKTNEGIHSVHLSDFNEVVFKNLVGDSPSFPSDIHGTTLKFSHNGISEDGNLMVNVVISKGKGDPVSTSFTIIVSGIDKAEADADIDLIKNFISTKWKNGKLDVIKAIKAVSWTDFNEDELQKLAGDTLSFPSDIHGTTLKFSHSGISEDGELEVYVKISKNDGITRKSIFSIKVTGIDKAKADADIAEVKKSISAWTDGKLDTSSEIKSVNNQTLDKQALKALAGDTLSFPSGIHGTTLKFSHDSLTQDGNLKVNIDISKSKGETVSTSFTIDVSGIDKAKADADIDDVQKALSQLTHLKLQATKEIPAATNKPFTKETLKEYGFSETLFPGDTKDVSITFSHQVITQDGQLIINVKFSKEPGESITKSFVIDVDGINKAKANKDILEIYDEISKWKGSLKTDKTEIPEVKKDIFDEHALKEIAGNSIPFIKQQKGTILTFSHSKIDANGKLIVNVEISKKYGDINTASFTIDVSGIDEAKADADIDDVQKALSQLTHLKLQATKEIPAATNKSFTKETLKEYGFSETLFPGDTKDVAITFSHQGITQDGSLTVNVKFSKEPGESITKSFVIDVDGINKAKANKDISEIYDEISKWKGSLKTDKTEIPEVKKDIFDEHALKEIAGNSITFIKHPKGTDLSFSHSKIDANGKLIVHVEISKNCGDTKTASFAIDVSGIDKAKADADISEVKKSISGWVSGKLSTQNDIQPVNSPKPFNAQVLKELAGKTLDFPANIYKANLTYTHNGISKDGSLHIKVNISKEPGEAITKSFNIEVRGINKAKAEKLKNSINDVKKSIKSIKINKIASSQKDFPKEEWDQYKQTLQEAMNKIESAKDQISLSKIKQTLIKKVSKARNNYEIAQEALSPKGNINFKKSFNPKKHKKLTAQDLIIKSPKGFRYSFVKSSDIDENGKYTITFSINIDYSNSQAVPKQSNMILDSRSVQSTEPTMNENILVKDIKTKSNSENKKTGILWILLYVSLGTIFIAISYQLFKKWKSKSKK